MAVFVDPLRHTSASAMWPYRASCHLIADDLEELHAFAEQLGLKRSWFQERKIPVWCHYDLTPNKRKLALKCGAERLSSRDFVRRIWRLTKESFGQRQCKLDRKTSDVT